MEFCNQCIDDTLDANPVIVSHNYKEGKLTGGTYWIPDETKTLLKNNLRDNLQRKIMGIQTIENLILDIEPFYTFTEGILSVKGPLIGMSDIDHYFLKMLQPQYDALNEIHVSSSILLFDEDIECQGATFKFDVSQCLVIGKKSIDLSGIDGRNGADGTKGGDFIGKFHEFEHPNNLTIITNGGNGGKGRNGENGTDADLNNLGNPIRIEGYHYIHKSNAENPPAPWFQCFPKAMEWTIQGTRNFFEKLGEVGKPGGKGGAGGSGGTIRLIKSTPHSELLVDTHGLDGNPGNDGKHGRPGRTGIGIELTNSNISYQTLVQQNLVLGNLEGWNLMNVSSSGHEQLHDIWEVPPHHVGDRTPGQ